MIGLRKPPTEIRPGSFSKNYGFESESESFAKLRRAIALSFDATLQDVSRDTFRENHATLTGSALIPLNFFLFNYEGLKGDTLAVDELVLTALSSVPGQYFDVLSFVAFHLNCVGTWKGADPWQSRPATWAAKFISEKLAGLDDWSSRTTADFIEVFLEDNLQYDAESPRKFATNYASFFRYAGLATSTAALRRKLFLKTCRSSAFLLFDRQILTEGKFIESVDHEDFVYLCMVFGVDHAWAKPMLELAIDEYRVIGGYGRLSSPIVAPIAPGAKSVSAVDIASFEDRESEVRFKIRLALARERNRETAKQIKAHYGRKCQICNSGLQVGKAGEMYSEAAHIHPIGTPHNGPDVVSNMLSLCPNHHIQLDMGILGIESGAAGYATRSVRTELSGVVVMMREPHTLRNDVLDYHRDTILIR